MLSPMSRGLFHRAISHSGTIYNGWSDPSRPGTAREKALKIAEFAGCTGDTTQKFECLKIAPAKKLTEALTKLYFWDNDPVVILQPVIEDFASDEEPFISERNFGNNSVEIPWLIGMNGEEGLLKVGGN